jgi:hypothetical protein
VPSIDVSQYVDLSLFDLNSQDIYLKALEYARIALPEWSPVDGAIETVLMQAMAIEVQELATSINRLPGGVVEALLGLMGSKRRDGTVATGEVRIDAAVQTNVAVPSGIRLFYTSTEADSALTIITTKSATLTSDRPLASLARTNSGVGIAVGMENLNLTEANIGDSITILSASTPLASLNGEWIIVDVPSADTVYFTSPGIEIAETSLAGAGTLTVPATVAPFAYVPVTAVLTGYHFIAADTPLQIMSSLREVASITLSTDLDGGSDPETDASYFIRASSALSRMTSALVTAAQMAQYVAGEYPVAYRVKAQGNVGAGRIGETPGSVYIVAAPIGASTTNALSSGVLTAIADDVASKSHAALEVNVDGALVVQIDAQVTLVGADHVTSQIVENTCITALQAYFNPDSWDWSNRIRINEVMTVVRNALYNGKPVVKYVTGAQISVTNTNIDSLLDPGWNTVATASRTSDVLTVPASGSNLSSGDIVAISLVPGVSQVYLVTAASLNEFSVDDIGDDDATISVDWVQIGVNNIDDTGDIELSDYFPLTMSGSHQITTE